jgi:hypothetical protein
MTRRRKNATRSVQAGDVTYNFHTLGWYQFQKLCAAVLTDYLGQTVQTFSPGNDEGRDAAFSGEWKTVRGERLAGSFTFQVKYSRYPERPLTLGILAPELAKARDLVRRGLSDNYIVLTNHIVTGQRATALQSAVQAELGCKSVHVYGPNWLTDAIRDSSHLRMLVPRVYGLGDLGEILDQRAYEQAKAILSWMPSLKTIVTTDAMQRAARMLTQHRFVFLVGDAMVGKTTAACSLAIGALDHLGLRVLKVRTAEEFARHWNSDKGAKQFFWIDDAFGETIYDDTLTRAWGRHLDVMSAALDRGACIVMTSRSYIWRAASDAIKSYAFDPFKKNEVVIRLEDLTSDEQAEILYNHIRMGTQPTSFKAQLGPHLPELAMVRPFYPEAARRLANPAFTASLSLDRPTLTEYFSNPKDILLDIVTRLGPSQKALLALIFARGGSLPAPLNLSDGDRALISRFGTTEQSISEALLPLSNGFIRNVIDLDGVASYQFTHPTLGDAMAEMTASRPEWLEIYLAGATTVSILMQTNAGGLSEEGVSIPLPAIYYDTVICKIAEYIRDPKGWGPAYWIGYLKRRAGRAFLKRALELCPQAFEGHRYYDDFEPKDDDFLAVCLRLNRYGLLAEDIRLQAVSRMRRYLNRSLTFLDAPKLRPLRTDEERAVLLAEVAARPEHHIASMIDSIDENYSSSDDPDPFYAEAFEYIEHLSQAFPHNLHVEHACQAKKAELDEHVAELQFEYENRDRTPITNNFNFAKGDTVDRPERNIFSDVADPI